MSDLITLAEARPGDGIPAYRDASLPAVVRAADLLGRMTAEEKVAQLGSVWSFTLLGDDGLDVARARQSLRHGIGHITRVSGGTNLDAAGAARAAAQIAEHLRNETRLGIPAIVHEEALHGLVARGSVCHPQAIGMAASWQPELVERMAGFIGRAMRARGAHQALSPILDITRDPRWGRMEETFGEDSYLVATLGLAYVRGLQGEGIAATGKHLVGHGAPDGGMNRAPAHIGARELRDTYLFPFEVAVREGGIRSVMHAYEDVDGVPCVASHLLLTQILRDEWGFDGVVVSDYNGVEELVGQHQLVSDLGQAAVMALAAGMDVELPGTVAYGAPLLEALALGNLDPIVLDRAVERVLRQKLELGLFEDIQPSGVGPLIADTEERALARQMAAQSLVLLENDGILPLAPDLLRVAIVGPNADDPRALLGDYSHVAHIQTLIEMRDRMNAFDFPVPGALAAADELAGLRTVRAALTDRLGADVRVSHARGSGLSDGDDAEIAQAVAMARDAQVVVAVLGERSGLTDDCTSGEARDRMDIGLPGRQTELLHALLDTGTPVVLVLLSGRPLAIPEAALRCAAILHAWVPGDEGAEAIAAALLGDVSPGGKLPVTVPRHVGQVPMSYAHKPSGGHSTWKTDYVDGASTPLWPFGFGRSYARFELSELSLSDAVIDADGEVAISVSITNLSARAADEVVQLYTRDVEASVTRPVLELRGFQRVHLAPGERRRLTFLLGAEQLAFIDVRGELVVEPGLTRLSVGTSSQDLPLSAELHIRGQRRLIRQRTRYLTRVSVA